MASLASLVTSDREHTYSMASPSCPPGGGDFRFRRLRVINIPQYARLKRSIIIFTVFAIKKSRNKYKK